MNQHLHQVYRRHGPFLLVALLFVSFRLLALVTLRTGGFVADFSDYDFYATWGQLTHMGYTTFDNLWTAYPPLFAALMLPVFELSSRIPPWIEPRFWFHLLFGLMLLVFETGNLVLVYRLGARLEREESRLTTAGDRSGLGFTGTPGLGAAILYALLFVPAYTMLGWFEPLPLFFMLLGLELLLLTGRWGWMGSAVAAALGFLVKLTPMVLVPIAVRRLGAKLSWRAARDEWFDRKAPGNLLRPTVYVAIFLGIVLGLGYLLVGGRMELAFSSFTINSIRPPWQSIWAVIDGYYGYGLVPLDMRNLTKLDQPLFPSRLPWGLITIAFLLLYLWLYTRDYDWNRDRTPIAFAGVSIIWLFLYSKGWSPQFLVWVLAFLVLLMPTLRGVAYAIVLSLINVVEAYVFLIMLPDEHWIMVGTVVLRTLLLIVLAAEWLGQIWAAAAPRLVRASAMTGWAIMGLALATALVSVPRAAQAYEARRFAELPCSGAVDHLQDAADGTTHMILTEEIDLWRELYPWLRQRYTIRVLDSYSPVDEAPDAVVARQLDQLLSGGEAWWIERAPAVTAPADFQEAAIAQLDAGAFGPCQLSRLVKRSDASIAVADVAGGPIVLRAANITHPAPESSGARTVTVVLYWEADEVVSESYTVFTQLFGPDGTMIAQQDNLPVNGLAPTDTWQPQTLIRDPYQLALPAGAPAGEYRLHVGLYTADGRSMITLDDGSTADHIEFPLTIE